MKAILFVDDEADVLENLRSMLVSVQKDWRIDFATSARQAFELMSQRAYQVVASDMHMPGVSGFEFLEWVRQHSPNAMRIAMTGHVDTETSYKALGVAHQYLAKPFNSSTLISTLKRISTLQEVIGRDHLRNMVSTLRTLPSLPLLYLEIVRELQTGQATSKSIGQIVARDPAMTAKVLQVVNSAFLSLPQYIADPIQATSLLGIETIRDLVITIHVFSQFSPAILERLGLNTLWDHSLSVASISKSIAKTMEIPKDQVEYSFTSGLLHDLGKLILAENYPMQYYSALGLSARKAIPLYKAEEEIFGATHMQIGAYLISLWGLPQSVVEALAYHATPLDSPLRGFTPVTAVHVANALDHENTPRRWEKIPPSFDTQYLAESGLADKIGFWREVGRDSVIARTKVR